MKERILMEVPEQRDRYTKHFQMEKKGMAAAVYPTPVHFEEEGTWKQIDNRLEADEENGCFKNKSSAVHVTFAEDPVQRTMVSVEKEGRQISWGLITPMETRKARKAGACRFRVLETEAEPETPQVNMRSALQAEAEAAEESREEEIRRLMKVAHLTGEGIYENILEGVDLSYTVSGETVKENITLKTKESAGLPLTFRICHPGITARKDKDGSLKFLTEDRQVAFEFPKPFMFDANLLRSDDVHFEITAEEGQTLMTVIPDQEWLQAEGRAYPVIIDPATETSKDRKNIEDTFICEKNQGSVYGNGSFVIGNVDEYGKSRTLLRFKNLPSIGNGSIVYGAKMYIWQYGYDTYGIDKIQIQAHEVTNDWNESTVRWNSQPATNTDVLDYQDVKQVVTGGNISITPVGFDITKLVRQWYNTSQNFGILLKSRQEGETALANKAYARFFASDYPSTGGYQITADQYPSGIIYYRNVNGLEDYQSYHDQAAGRAGTGHTNDYTGNVVWIHSDAATSGGPMPAEIRHVYNSSECQTASRFGYGWRISVMQELRASGIKDYPYVYTDEDGTRHYFYTDKEDANKLKDEDGLGLVITQTSSAIHDSYMKMQTKDKDTYTFGQDGYLRVIEDLDGNKVNYNYGPNNAGNFIGDLSDATGARMYFTYTTDAAKTRLTAVTDSVGRKTSYGYDGAGNLISITYPDGKQSLFAYDAQHKLLRVRDIDGYSIEYTYTNDFQVPRVSQVTEKGSGDVLGQVLKISYRNGNTTVFEEPGLDGDIATTADNRTLTYHFDNTGRPTDVIDQNGYANTYTYYSEGMKNNKLSKSGSTQKNIINLLRNPVFDPAHEANDGWNNFKTTIEAIPYSVIRVDHQGHFGKRCIQMTKGNEKSVAGVTQRVTLNPGTYTLSAYVRTENIACAEGKGANLRIAHSNDSVEFGKRYINYTTDTAVDDGWERLTLTFTVTVREWVDVCGAVCEAAGTAWFDGFQLEEGSIANKLNLINNPGFEIIENGNPAGWGHDTGSSLDGYINTADRGICARLGGEIAKRKSYSQAFNLDGKEDAIYNLSCWVKASAVPEKEFRIAAALIYESGDPRWNFFECNPNITDWQFVSGVFHTEDENPSTSRKCVAIHIYLFFGQQANQVLFDSVQLIRDDGDSYVYDSDGNLVSAKSAAEKANFTHDSKDNVTKMDSISGTSFEYAYDTKNHMTSAKNSEGVRYQLTYDAKGNPLTSRAQGGKCVTAIIPGRTYYIREKMSGNYLDVSNGGGSETGVILYDFKGVPNQKWKVTATKDGQYTISPQHKPGLCLDLKGGNEADKAEIWVYTANNSDSQKWKFHPMDKGAYQISCKKTKNKKGLTNVSSNTANEHPVSNYTLHDEYNNQQWYFEPADEGTVSDTPKDGGIYYFRVRHSSQYLDVKGISQENLTITQGDFYNGGLNQQFRLSKYDSEYYYLEPMHAPGMVLAKGDKNAQGYYALVQTKKIIGEPTQLFRFKEIEIGKGTGYLVEGKDGRSLNLMNAWYTPATAMIVTPIPGANLPIPENMWFLLEECSEAIETSMTYTPDGRNVKTITDPRGNVTTNEYDSANRMLTAVTDANGSKTSYTYDQNTDQLTKITKTVSGTPVSIGYTYEKDRIKTITHNGFNYEYTYDEFGNPTSVGAGGKLLEANTYNKNNGLPALTIYGNLHQIENEYNKDGELTGQYLTRPGQSKVKMYTNTYDNYGNQLVHEDLLTGITYRYQYDLIDRILGVDTSDGQKLRISYDKKNRPESYTNKVNGKGTVTKFHYGKGENQQKPGLIYGVQVDSVDRISYQYDSLGRIASRSLNLPGKEPYVTSHTFVKGHRDGTTTTLVESIKNDTAALFYTYDVMGNIKTISEQTSGSTAKVLKASYTYDESGQLIREDSVWEGKTITYTYDAGGNMTSKKEYAYTTGALGAVKKTLPYTYRADGWKDQMTSYDGQAVYYDEMGNPTTYRGMTMGWDKGRELVRLTNGAAKCQYEYDVDGNRISKTVNGAKTRYYLNGSTVMAEIRGDGERFDYLYDNDGMIFGFLYKDGYYFYKKNVQGDIIGIIDSNRAELVQYQYNSWGKLISTTGSQAGTLGAKNPFRYRGYYYDAENALYYLNSRYYDPETGRFLNADDVGVINKEIEHMIGNNLYAYCFNNPVILLDDEGTWPKWATQVLIGVAVIGVAAAVSIATGGAGAGVAGYIAAGVLKGAAVGAISGATTGAVGGSIRHIVSTGTWKGVGKAALQGGAKGFMTGAITGAITGGAYRATQTLRSTNTSMFSKTGKRLSSQNIISKGKITKKTFYDIRGKAKFQIHYSNHGNPKYHSTIHGHIINFKNIKSFGDAINNIWKRRW